MPVRLGQSLVTSCSGENECLIILNYEHDVDMKLFVSKNALWFLLHIRISLAHLIVLLCSSVLIILGALGQYLIDQGLVNIVLS